jgi:hypothetical protein
LILILIVVCLDDIFAGKLPALVSHHSGASRLLIVDATKEHHPVLLPSAPKNSSTTLAPVMFRPRLQFPSGELLLIPLSSDRRPLSRWPTSLGSMLQMDELRVIVYLV